MVDLSISKDEYREILSNFILDIGYRMPTWGLNFSIQEPTMRYFDRQPWEPHMRRKAVEMAHWMAPGIGMCFPYLSRDVQVAYAIFSTWTLFIDDIGGEIEDALKAFERNLIHGKPQSTPILQSYVEYLQGFEKLFGPYSGAVVSTTATSWIYGSVIELKYEGKIKPPAGAFNFPRFVRDKCGIAEPNFHMVFPEELFPEESHLEIFLPIIPDLNDCINYINDVLSFYKETVVGPERFTYICNLAEVQSISIQDALRLTCAGIIQNMRNIRKVLSRCPQILDAADQFLCGYISWHLFQDRYRLSEIELVDANGNRIRRPGQEHEA